MKRTKRISGRLYRRGIKGIYYLDWTFRGQRFTKCLGTPIKRDAEQEAARTLAPYQTQVEAETVAALVARVEQAENTAADLGEGVLLDFAWEAYLEAETRPQSGPETLKHYAGHFKAFAEWMANNHEGVTSLREVNAEHASAFIRHLSARGLSGARINKHIVFLRSFFRVLAPLARMKTNPFAGIAKRHHQPESKRPFTIEQLRTIIETAKGEMKTLFMLGTFTGLRLGDAATLLWSEVDLPRRIITRVPSKTKRKGEPVVVGIPEILAQNLEAVARKNTYVIPEIATLYKSDGEKLSRHIQAHLEQCGIHTTKPGTGFEVVRGKEGKETEKHTGTRAVVLYGFHSLRHSYVSLHAAAGTPQAVMMKLAGHGSPIMNQHYTHLSAETARTTAAALPTILGEPEKPKREPLPKWALEAVKRARTLKTLRAELLKGVT